MKWRRFQDKFIQEGKKLAEVGGPSTNLYQVHKSSCQVLLGICCQVPFGICCQVCLLPRCLVSYTSGIWHQILLGIWYHTLLGFGIWYTYSRYLPPMHDVTLVPDRNGWDEQADQQHGGRGSGEGRLGHKHKTLRWLLVIFALTLIHGFVQSIEKQLVWQLWAKCTCAYPEARVSLTPTESNLGTTNPSLTIPVMLFKPRLVMSKERVCEYRRASCLAEPLQNASSFVMLFSLTFRF